MGIGIGIGIGAGKQRSSNWTLPSLLLAKFQFLWTGKSSGNNLVDDINGVSMPIVGKDFTSRFIPGDSEATLSVPDNATFLAADGADDFWFNGANVLQQKTLADLIVSTTLRTFIKYADFEPYNVSIVGILKEGEVLTDADKIALNRYFKLWVQYWGVTMMESGYMKDNRTFIESPAIVNGLLYSFPVISNIKNLAPLGWSVPTQAQFNTLITYLGGAGIAGGKLKQAGTDHWTTPNTGADNSSGFTLFGSGRRSSFNGAFISINTAGSLWSCTVSGPEAYALSCSYNNDDVSLTVLELGIGCSVRCIRDTNDGWEAGEVMIDIDGNVYDTVQIGTQIWTVQNLRVTKYRNGDAIPEITSNAAWLTTVGLCAYSNNWANV